MLNKTQAYGHHQKEHGGHAHPFRKLAIPCQKLNERNQRDVIIGYYGQLVVVVVVSIRQARWPQYLSIWPCEKIEYRGHHTTVDLCLGLR